MFRFLPFLISLLNLLKSWTNLKLYTLSDGKGFDRRRTSLCISVKKRRFKNFSILTKLVLCLVVLLLTKTNDSSSKTNSMYRNLKNQEYFTLESLLTGETVTCENISSKRYAHLVIDRRLNFIWSS